MLKEISRRCEMGENGGVACGPFSITAVVAEMVIDEDGLQKYLTCCWVSEASDAVSFEVTEKPLLPFYIDLDTDQDEMEEARDSATENYTSYDGEYEGAYSEQYAVLVSMIKEKLIKEELVDPEDFEDECDWGF